MARKTTQFKKGQSGNPNGRPKGTKNRTTEEMRQFIQDVVNKNFDRLEEDLDNMKPLNRWLIMTKLTNYFMPILSKNDNNNLNSGEVTIKVKYVDDISKKDDLKIDGD